MRIIIIVCNTKYTTRVYQVYQVRLKLDTLESRGNCTAIAHHEYADTDINDESINKIQQIMNIISN